MPSSQDAESQPKRPAAVARHSSTSSHVSQSPSDGGRSPSSRKAGPHKAQRHVVGHGRMGPRNASFGKNLHKASKGGAVHGGDGPAAARHHRRVRSGDAATPSTSPQAARMKRNASATSMARSKSNTVLRKNHSSGHLHRQASKAAAMKGKEAAKPRPGPGKSRDAAADSTHVRFDIGDDGAHDQDHDDAWTEESASQSPCTTRSNTRSNSVVLEHAPPKEHMAAAGSEAAVAAGAEKGGKENRMQIPLSPTSRLRADRAHDARQINGGSSYQPSRPPDADIITSKLLQRSTSGGLPPQTSSVSATGVSDSHAADRSLSHSQGSAVAETPGRELVSRFINGDGSSGTPRGSSFLPPRESPKQQASDLDVGKRNKSAPNMADRTHSNPRAPSRRSGTSTPTDLHPSRTQQKLWLQRASSNLEPQKHVPAILPRTGGPPLLGAGLAYASAGDGRIDPRLQRQFDQATLEYRVVRRFRNPIADAVLRIGRLPGAKADGKKPALASGISNGYVQVHAGDARSALSQSPRSVKTPETGAAVPRKSRVSFEIHDGRAEGEDLEGRQSFESDGGGRPRDGVEEICRRLWDARIEESSEGD